MDTVYSANLSVAEFRYTLLPEKEIHIPAAKRGNILRGAFGYSLRRLVCINEKYDCPACSARETCAYFLIFSPWNLTSISRLRDTPRGFVINPPLGNAEVYTQHSPLQFSFILIGSRIMYHPWIIVPLQALGRIGLGTNRGRFEIYDIEAVKDGQAISIFNRENRIVKNVALEITKEDIMNRVLCLSKDCITLEFVTPTRIKYNPTGEKGKSRVVNVPEFHHVIKRLRDRINALSIAYGNGPMNVDFREMGRRAEAVTTQEVHIEWQEARRRKRNPAIWHDLSGFKGRVTYVGDIEPFLPLIAFGEYVHVGEDAVFGNGWYRVV